MTTTEIEHAKELAAILERAEETTLGPTDSALAAKALRLLTERLRGEPHDAPEKA